MSTKEIKTTGDLRQVLADTIVSVINGDIEIDDANAMQKLAKNITDSLYSETKIRMFANDIGETNKKMGDMNIGNSDT
jgi:hypothetical protein